MSAAQSVHSEALNARQQGIIPIAAFTANGDTAKLKEALVQGLDKGLAVNEIKEVLVQMYAYTGFPRSLTGLNTFLAVLEDREKQGIKDEVARMRVRCPQAKASANSARRFRLKLSAGRSAAQSTSSLPSSTPI